MDKNIYDQLSETGKSGKIDIERRTDLKNIYDSFFRDFRQYLTEFVKESINELTVAEIPVSIRPLVLFENCQSGRYLTLKNQGQTACYIRTNGGGGFRLDAGEKEKMWVNKTISIVTVSGNTTLGVIQN